MRPVNSGDVVAANREARHEFVSHVSHELRVPMTSIMGYTDLLIKGIVGPLNEQQLNFLKIIRGNVERMAGLISSLSDLSGLDTGTLTLTMGPVSLPAVITDVASYLQPLFVEKNQTLAVTLPPDLPPLQADSRRLGQVLTSLLHNANRYTPTGGSIQLQAAAVGELVRIEVSDNGVGISLQDQPHIFEQFFRSEHPQVREQPGWGLSLSVCQRLTEQMGGVLGFTSQPEAGSTFWLTLLSGKN